MPLLRHVVINNFELLDPVCGENDLILEYLQTLCVSNLKCSRAVIKRIPNIKTLRLIYVASVYNHDFVVNNIRHLTELQSLKISFFGGLLEPNLVPNLHFPDSLKKLSLHGTNLNWEECATKIGSLPLLQYLRLESNSFQGSEWETIEGGFSSLKVLILACPTLRYWTTEDTHFPCLEHLELQSLEVLEEIPASIGDIPTLKSIELHYCFTSAEDSAKRIQDEQLELGNTDLQIHILDFGAQKHNTNPAHLYVKEVEETFKDQIEKYGEFLDYMNDYHFHRIDKYDVVRKVKVLFKGHPSLLSAFNSLLPEGHNEFTLTDEEEEAPLLP